MVVLPVAALAAALAVSAATAPAAGPEELIVTGTRLAADLQVVPGSASVIDREEIEARNDAVVVDLLRDLPGLHVNQPGAGGVTQVFIRGSEPNFTVFLLDGIRVNDPNNTRGGSFDLATLNLADIERVEIVRGPQSSIYGSDGLAGVVNFISRRGSEALSATADVEAGGDDFLRGTLQVGGPAGRKGDFSLQATRRDDGEAVPGSTYEADTVSGRLHLEPASAVTANVYARYASSDSTTFPEQSGGPGLAVLRDLQRANADDFTLGADADWAINGMWSLQALASLYDRSDEYASPGIAPGDQVPPNGAANDLERRNASLRATVRPSGKVVATLGVDYQRESGESVGYVDFAPDFRVPNNFDLDRDIVGLFAEGRYLPDEQWILQASIRHDDPDEVSGETTGKVGAVYALANGTTRLRANWGSGFKLPSFFALGSPLVGEPDLRPETSSSLEAGLTQLLMSGAAEVSVTLFDNEYRDLIDFDPDTFRNVNRDKVTTRGVELAGTWSAAPDLRLRAHATYTHIDVKDSDRELQQRPDWRGGAALRWAPARDWLLDLDWLYVGTVLDSSIPTGILELDAWNRVDLRLSWMATPRLRLAIAVDNLLDADYQEAIGFPAAGVRPRFGVRYLLGGAP
ncbi:MAG: TonB-dependent receptor [Chromatiales bacterium]|nr:TonB-dependent receptor [Chromatiales bacterium]